MKLRNAKTGEIITIEEAGQFNLEAGSYEVLDATLPTGACVSGPSNEVRVSPWLFSSASSFVTDGIADEVEIGAVIESAKLIHYSVLVIGNYDKEFIRKMQKLARENKVRIRFERTDGGE